MRKQIAGLLGLVALAATTAVSAYEPTPERVTDGVYALVGPITGRTAENDALNNNQGFVITDEGVVLIDSGASTLGAQKIDAAIDTVTDKPVTHVINTGSQDHRWLGNGYFRDQGAEIIALARTVETQKRFAEQHMDRLEGILGERLEGTTPVHAADPIDADRSTFEIGGTEFQLIFFGDAHFPGDAVVWLPKQETVFTGDMVYVDRMLGIHPFSDVVSWRQAFHAMEQLEPEHVVPGHGGVCDLEKARAETGDYLDFLVTEVRGAVADFQGLQTTVDELADAPRFEHLEHFDSWHRTNINRAFLQLEME